MGGKRTFDIGGNGKPEYGACKVEELIETDNHDGLKRAIITVETEADTVEEAEEFADSIVDKAKELEEGD